MKTQFAELKDPGCCEAGSECCGGVTDLGCC
jgi:hypothetical protein